MLDLFISDAIYKRVMGEEKIKNKFFGFFWREALVFLAFVILVFHTPLFNVVLAALVLLVPCVVLPVIHFKALNGKIDRE